MQAQLREWVIKLLQQLAKGEVEGKGNKGNGNQGKKGNRSQDAYYCRWVEFGTVKMSARPFMRPAFETQKEAAVQEIARVLAERIKQEVRTLPGATG